MPIAVHRFPSLVPLEYSIRVFLAFYVISVNY